MFGFPLDMDTSCEKLRKSRRFVAHAKNMIGMLDRAFNMLGPDDELLAVMLLDLGNKHVAMGVTSDTFPIMGESLIQTLREQLGEYFTPAVEASWWEVYKALSHEMVTVIENSKK